MQHEFGSAWTEEKLDHVSKYLHAYTTLMTRNLLLVSPSRLFM